VIVAGNARLPIDDGAVLITGASAGIGRELAVQLAPRARMLILLARRAGRLEELRASLLAKRPRLQRIQPASISWTVSARHCARICLAPGW
jgi:short-subunit dehydrogenase